MMWNRAWRVRQNNDKRVSIVVRLNRLNLAEAFPVWLPRVEENHVWMYVLLINRVFSTAGMVVPTRKGSTSHPKSLQPAIVDVSSYDRIIDFCFSRYARCIVDTPTIFSFLFSFSFVINLIICIVSLSTTSTIERSSSLRSLLYVATMRSPKERATRRFCVFWYLYYVIVLLVSLNVSTATYNPP